MNTTARGLLLAGATFIGVLTLANAAPGTDGRSAAGEPRPARTGEQRVEILPASEIAVIAEREGMRVHEMELENEDGLARYEVKARNAQGRRLELRYDARDGERLAYDGDEDERSDDD